MARCAIDDPALVRRAHRPRASPSTCARRATSRRASSPSLAAHPLARLHRARRAGHPVDRRPHRLRHQPVRGVRPGRRADRAHACPSSGRSTAGRSTWPSPNRTPWLRSGPSSTPGPPRSRRPARPRAEPQPAADGRPGSGQLGGVGGDGGRALAGRQRVDLGAGRHPGQHQDAARADGPGRREVRADPVADHHRVARVAPDRLRPPRAEQRLGLADRDRARRRRGRLDRPRRSSPAPGIRRRSVG